MFVYSPRKLIFLLPVYLSLLLIAACSKKEPYIQGYIDVRLAYISANYQGVLQQLLVRRGDVVKPGQVLFVLEAQPESDSYLQSKAELDDAISARNDAQTKLEFQKLALSRRQTLAQSNVISAEALDQAKVDYKNAVDNLSAANAKVNSAKAKLQTASWSKSKKSVAATQEASVFDTYFLPFELVPGNQAVLSLIIPNEIRAILFVKEPELSHFYIGQTIYVKCDGYNKRVPAKISFISPRAELTPPVLYSTKERAKFVYRVEADRMTNHLQCFHPGQPVQIVLNIEPPKQQSAFAIILKRLRGER